MISESRFTKQQYAVHYDAIASESYRFALLILGDAPQAQRAVVSAFRQGWTALRSDDRFLEGFLELVWAACARSIPASGAQYTAVISTCGSEWVAPLGTLYWDERGLLLLEVMFGCTVEAMAKITRSPLLRIDRRRRALAAQLEQKQRMLSCQTA